MVDFKHNRLPVSWVLVNELAVGPAPLQDNHIEQLQEQSVKAVLSLCSTEEAPPPAQLIQTFPHKRLVLPDHRTGRLPTSAELLEALSLLSTLHQQHGPVFVHCVAAVERSPLVCLGWLVKRHQLSPDAALDYLMQVHPRTNPLPGQLALLRHPELR
jgi:predicted protein tyrosine phosphatase